MQWDRKVNSKDLLDKRPWERPSAQGTQFPGPAWKLELLTRVLFPLFLGVLVGWLVGCWVFFKKCFFWSLNARIRWVEDISVQVFLLKVQETQIRGLQTYKVSSWKDKSYLWSNVFSSLPSSFQHSPYRLKEPSYLGQEEPTKCLEEQGLRDSRNLLSVLCWAPHMYQVQGRVLDTSRPLGSPA